MQTEPCFQLIPVIDLKDGYVVHAKAGNRHEYQAIHQYSKLVKESSIDSVITAFRLLYPFKTFYIADLNAICKNGNHHQLISTTLEKYKDYEFWIDDGSQQGHISYQSRNYKAVYGTEIQECELRAMNDTEIISLDFKQGQHLGLSSWFINSSLWSKHLLIMNLDYVGSQFGPDTAKLIEYVTKFPDKKIYAAGGVRNNTDLINLKRIGVAGVLLASALHQGGLNFDGL